MVNNLCPVLKTRHTRVFCPMENTNQHKEFRLKALSFLSLGAFVINRVRAKVTPLFLHSKPFLDRQVNEGRHVASLKRKPGMAPTQDDVSFLCSGDRNVI